MVITYQQAQVLRYLRDNGPLTDIGENNAQFQCVIGTMCTVESIGHGYVRTAITEAGLSALAEWEKENV